jgi:hypothetical protein
MLNCLPPLCRNPTVFYQITVYGSMFFQKFCCYLLFVLSATKVETGFQQKFSKRLDTSEVLSFLLYIQFKVQNLHKAHYFSANSLKG